MLRFQNLALHTFLRYNQHSQAIIYRSCSSLGCHHREDTHSANHNSDSRHLSQDAHSPMLSFLCVFMVVSGVEVERNKADSAISGCIASVLVLESQETPNGTPEEFKHHHHGSEIVWNFKLSTRLRWQQRENPHEAQDCRYPGRYIKSHKVRKALRRDSFEASRWNLPKSIAMT